MTDVKGVTVTSESGVTSFVPCNPGETSDGYHTIDELYEHRFLLFAALMKNVPRGAWRSRLHADGSSYPGWFVAGMELPSMSGNTSITYHMPDRLWDLLDNIPVLDHAPEWDGHTSQDVLERLEQWTAGIRILFVNREGQAEDDLHIHDEVLVDPSWEDLKNTSIGEWYRVLHTTHSLNYLHIRGKDCIITLEPRPNYCNRGSWLAKLEVLDGIALTVDAADGWYPGRYYFDRARAILEIEAWLRARSQMEASDAPSA